MIIVLTSVSLMGIVFTQLYWVKKAVTLKKEQFDGSVTIALKSVVNQLHELYNDSTLRKIKQEGPNCVIQKTEIRDIINPVILDSLIQEEMGCFQIKLDYEYAIVNFRNNSFVMGVHDQYKDQLLERSHKVSLASLYKPGKYWLAIYFPSQRSIIMSQMILWVILSALFLLIIILTFVFIIYSFIRQKKLSEMKTDFVNNMTHEFKTPISTISLTSEILQKADVYESPMRTKKYAKVIYDENARLQNQVERILQIAILDKGETKIKIKEVDVHRIIMRAVENFNLTINQREGNIMTYLNASRPVIYADRMHLINIINNLLENANKYTPENPQIIITTKNIKKGILISVEDNGIGISHENQKNIFKKLYRVPTGNLHDVKGFGLGLYYVKTIVESHDGFIHLHSEPDRGSKFEIYFPSNDNKMIKDEEKN